MLGIRGADGKAPRPWLPGARLRWREAPRLCLPPVKFPGLRVRPPLSSRGGGSPCPAGRARGGSPGDTLSLLRRPSRRSSGGRSLRGLPGSFTRAPAVSQALRGGLRSGSRGRRLSSAPRALRRAGGLHVAPGSRLSHCRWEHVLSEGGPRAPPASGQETRLPRVQGPAGRCPWVALASVHTGEVPGAPPDAPSGQGVGARSRQRPRFDRAWCVILAQRAFAHGVVCRQWLLRTSRLTWCGAEWRSPRGLGLLSGLRVRALDPRSSECPPPPPSRCSVCNYMTGGDSECP